MSPQRLNTCAEEESMSYEHLSAFAQTSGMIYFMAIFAAVCLYVFWPSNRVKFDKPARIPLENEDIDHVR
jgi:cytochrome c oxidase cbb3-type subunit 4